MIIYDVMLWYGPKGQKDFSNHDSFVVVAANRASAIKKACKFCADWGFPSDSKFKWTASKANFNDDGVLAI